MGHYLKQLLLLGVLLVIVLVFEIIQIPFYEDDLPTQLLHDSLGRSLASIILVSMLALNGKIKYFTTWKPITSILIIVLPILFIAINNFPFSAYFNGRTNIDGSVLLWPFIFECYTVGLFEEVLFRGIILVLLLRFFPNNSNGRFFSMLFAALVYAFAHTVNLIIQTSLLGAAGQIGFTFFFGFLLSFVFIKTRNLWYCVALHTIYYFTGMFFETFGGVVKPWDTLTIILTTILSLVVIVIFFFQFSKTTDDEVSELL